MRTSISIVICSGIVIAGWIGIAGFLRQTEARRNANEPIVRIPFDSSWIDPQIRNQEHVVQTDPHGALGWSFLCSAYMRRSRESDDLPTALKAEDAARHSLSVRHLGNSTGWNKLVQALLQEHRFKDALAETGKAFSARIYDDTTKLEEAECLVEIGRYDEAQAVIEHNPRAFTDASGKSIIARLLDINGQPEKALALMKQAAAESDAAPGMACNELAWFHAKLAAQLDKMGRHGEARSQYRVALALYPRDYKSLAGLAKLAFQERKWSECIDWGTKSNSIAQMADVHAMVGDAFAMLGSESEALNEYAAVAALVGRPSGMNDGMHEVTPGAGTHGHRLDRQYALYCADHNRDLDGAYASAIRDFSAREDVYSYDTLAWVCFKRGDRQEAKDAIKRALARGTKDPMILYHAGEIYAGCGEGAKSIGCYRQALAIDPEFDGVSAPRAKQSLKVLTRTASNAELQGSRATLRSGNPSQGS